MATVDDLRGEQATAVIARPGADDLAYLQYTSGSTGEPKGVMITHATLLANIRADGHGIAATPSEVFVSWLPLYHDMGLIGAWLGSLYFCRSAPKASCSSVVRPPRRVISATRRPRRSCSATAGCKRGIAATSAKASCSCLRSSDAERVARYRPEPYVVTRDVYGVAPHVDRDSWSWYTGATGWLYRAGS